MTSKFSCLILLAICVCLCVSEEDVAVVPSGGLGELCGVSDQPVPSTVCSEKCRIPSPIGSCESGNKCCLIIKDAVADAEFAIGSGGLGENCGHSGMIVPSTTCSDNCRVRSPIGSCASGTCCLIVKTPAADALPDITGSWGSRGGYCTKFYLPVPATVCSETCTVSSPIGHCDSGSSCCLLSKS